MEGDNPDDNAFLVKIVSNEPVIELKRRIKQEKSPEFDDIAADKLQLWQADVAFTAAQQIEDAKHKKLSALKKVVACWDPRPPKDCIHVIIARPSGK